MHCDNCATKCNSQCEETSQILLKRKSEVFIDSRSSAHIINQIPNLLRGLLLRIHVAHLTAVHAAIAKAGAAADHRAHVGVAARAGKAAHALRAERHFCRVGNAVGDIKTYR